jgi:hypothetical protein
VYKTSRAIVDNNNICPAKHRLCEVPHISCIFDGTCLVSVRPLLDSISQVDCQASETIRDLRLEASRNEELALRPTIDNLGGKSTSALLNSFVFPFFSRLELSGSVACDRFLSTYTRGGHLWVHVDARNWHSEGQKVIIMILGSWGMETQASRS